MGDAESLEPIAEEVALVRIEGEQVVVVALGEPERGRCGLLERRRCTDRQKVMDLADAVCDLGRGDRIAETLACDRIGLGERTAADRAFRHPGEGSQIDVVVRGSLRLQTLCQL